MSSNLSEKPKQRSLTSKETDEIYATRIDDLIELTEAVRAIFITAGYATVKQLAAAIGDQSALSTLQSQALPDGAPPVAVLVDYARDAIKKLACDLITKNDAT